MDRRLALRDMLSKASSAGLLRFASLMSRRPIAIWLLAAVLFHPELAVSQIVSQSLVAPPPERISVDQNNVDIVSGGIVFSKTELSIGPERYGLALTRFYSSYSGWSDSLSGMLQVSKMEFGIVSAVTASWGNQTWVFEDGAFNSRSGDGAVLSGISPGYTVTMRDGTVVTYSLLTPTFYPCSGPCTEYYFATNVEYPNGLTVKLHYQTFQGSLASGAWAVRIQSVTNNAGYQIKFNYQSNTVSADSSTWPAWHTRTKAVAVNNGVEYCNPTANACTLTGTWATVSYNNQNGTHTVTDSLLRVTRYTYSPTSFSIKPASSATDTIQYSITSLLEPVTGKLLWHVTSANLGAGTWTYEYWQNHPTDPTIRTITSRDPQNHPTVFTSKFPLEGWVLDSIKDPLNRTTTFSYPCAGSFNGALYFNSSSYSATPPEGNATVRVCDARGNVTSVKSTPKTGSNLGDLETEWTFPATCTNGKTCNQPEAIIDPKGNRTDYTYYPAHGGLDTALLPPVNVGIPPQPVISVRPLKRYSYASLYAYVRNASGALVQAASPIWMPTHISECRSSASCTGGADEVVTTFEYGAIGTVNRLLLRGRVVTSEGVSLRACYSYDQFGNQISVTTPRAALASCPE